ncbi:MAG TPA: histidine phosphatase family protein [Solirubrobacteraceae bacterium]|nr:histidine phosphatase family protein [Solirubrobacteraceae bacterium]
MGRVILSPRHLILVRHGESTWNAEERLQGQLDPPLSERGREQARALTATLNGLPDERVISSDLARARETAELLGLRPARFDPRWREIDVGAWAGRTAAEIDAEGDELTNWRGGPRRAPDGEPWDAFHARVSGAIDELLADGGPWVVICHGGCIRVAAAHLTGADHLRLGSPPNASTTVFETGSQVRLLVYGALPDGGLPTGLY